MRFWDLFKMAYPKQPAANIKLAAAILFLTTGDNYTNLQYQFRVHASTLSKFMPDVCDAIYRKMKNEYLRVSISSFHISQKN